MATDIRKPAWWWYLVAAVIGLGGSAGFVVFLLVNLLHIDDNFTRIAVPGTHEVVLREPGTYTVYHEYLSVLNNRQYSNQRGLAGLQLRVQATQTQKEVPVSAARISSYYSLGSRAGVSAFEFNADTPGRYLIVAQYASGAVEPEVVLAIGKGFMGSVLKIVLGGLAILGSTLATSILIVVLTFVKRLKAARQLSPIPMRA